jgi:hypothetical protein
VPILVTAKDERQKGFGRLFIDELSRLGAGQRCGLLVAWAAGGSMGFWQRVDMLDKQTTTDAVLKREMRGYEAGRTAGFLDSKMVARLISRDA